MFPAGVYHIIFETNYLSPGHGHNHGRHDYDHNSVYEPDYEPVNERRIRERLDREIECFTGDIPTFIKTDDDREVEDSLLNRWVQSLPEELSKDIADLYKEMDAQETKEAKLYKSLDKLEALIQHNESPIDTWSENEYELNKTYAFDTVSFSEWLTELRKAVLDDTLKKIEEGK